ncbi:MAG: DUF11 domain-containing protein, partial [Chloroflexota bacterium]
MQAHHNVKSQRLLTVFLLAAIPLSLFAIVVQRLEAVSLWGRNSVVDTVVAQADETNADLSLTKSVDDFNPLVGDTILFTIEVKNNGPSNATGVTVSDTLPNGYNYVSDDSGDAYDAGTGVWNVDGISDTLSAELQITATVNPSGNYTNVAQITGLDQTDPDTSNNQDSIFTNPIPAADLAMAKNVDDSTPFVGDQVIFTLRVDNNGPSDATGVEVTDQLPTGYTYVSDNGGGDYNPGSGVWNVGSIEDGDFDQLRITAEVNPSGNYNNVATITDLNEIDPNPDNDEDSASTNPRPSADLAMTKDVDDPTPFVGEQVTFTLRVDNDGPSDASGVEISDQLPSGYSYVSHSGGGVYLPGIGLWMIGSINAGAFVELQITAEVNPSGDYTNTAQITDLNERDPDDNNNQD